MNRDPFFDSIVRRLSESLDPNTFEACVVDLLRRDWPRLVPVVGGSDGGMDGAIGVEDGPPLPLVTTTARATDIASNLERNLRTYAARSTGARRAVLASSQRIGGTRRRKLEEVAQRLGFELAQIYDREALASLIYRNSRWAKELLGLTGAVPALSRVSGTARPLIGREAIGRDDELQWLRVSGGDKVLVGQPGSGKTFLLQILANENSGLFLASDDRNHIADSIRDQSPAAIFVDDAHVDLGKARTLFQLRAEIGGNFSIIATTWPSGQHNVEETLGLPPSASRELPRLGRDQIVKVISAAGVAGPTGLVRELVNQAEGRPGLAITLAHMCVIGAGEQVVTGDLLKRSIVGMFPETSSAEFLAAIALAGDEGVQVSAVADALDLHQLEARRLAANLAAGGIIFELPDHSLTVRPGRLRHALIKDVFYGPIPHQLEPIVSAISPSARALAAGLLGALHTGAPVPNDLLRDLLTKADSGSLLRDYAWWNGEAATWCLRTVPARLDDYVRAGLTNATEAFIPFLLEAAAKGPPGDENASLKTLKDWIESGDPATDEAVRFRSALCAAAIAFLNAGGNSATALAALELSLFPGFEDHETDPGRGRTLTLRFGILPEPQLREIAEQWNAIKAALTGNPDMVWSPMLSAAADWAYPGRHARSGAPEDIDRLCKIVATKMLRDICELSSGRPGVVHVANQIAKDAGLDFEAPTNRMFELVYPKDEFNEAVLRNQVEEVKSLAVEMRDESADRALAAIAYCEREALDAGGHRYPRLTPELCQFLSREVSNYPAWVVEARRLDLPADCADPFIAGVVRQRNAGWDTIVSECLDDSRYVGVTSALLVQASDIPGELLARAIQFPWNRMWLCVVAAQGSLSTQAIHLLLADNRDNIAGMTAVGLWKSNRVATETQTAVIEALLRCPPDEYELGEILKTNSQLARDYLVAQLTKSTVWDWSVPVAMKAALEQATESSRTELINLLSAEQHGDAIVKMIVSDSINVFRALLSRNELKSLRFAPLRVKHPSSEWLALIECALGAGHPPAEILHHWLHMPSSWSGSEAAMWRERAAELRALHQGTFGRPRELLQEMIAKCQTRAEAADEWERKLEIYGN